MPQDVPEMLIAGAVLIGPAHAADAAGAGIVVQSVVVRARAVRTGLSGVQSLGMPIRGRRLALVTT